MTFANAAFAQNRDGRKTAAFEDTQTLPAEQISEPEAEADAPIDEADSAQSQQQEEKDDAVNYTNAAPLKDTADVAAPMHGSQSAMQTMDAPEGLVLSKTVSGDLASGYLLTIEAYATGKVHITTGERPVPADIALVLDLSLSMNSDMISGYSAVSYTRNDDAYSNRSGLLVKVNGQYYSVNIVRSGNPYSYTYTYRYTGANGQVTATSSETNGSPPSWSFYKASTVSRLEALKTAANSFIDSIETKANADDGVDHRIAVVTYSDTASIISGSQTDNGAFVNVQNNVTGINTLQSAISGLTALRYTRSDLGLQKAVDILRKIPPDTEEQRNRIVVFFTDGAPASSGDGSFQAAVANPAIANAKTLKTALSASGCGATVYSIGIFDGANPTTPIGSASNENKFMHFVSSNYPDAVSMTAYGSGSNEGYYLSASDTAGLNSIFQSISESIQTGGADVELDATAIVRDVIAPYFKLPEGVSNISLFTSTANASTGEWEQRESFNGGVSISEDRKTIDVTGFDYAENYYAAIETDGEITGYTGKKLIIEIPIEYIPGSCFGGTVPTNKGVSGVYTDDNLVKALPMPTVDIPVNYDFTPVNQSIYLTHDAMLNSMFTTAAGYVADGVNNAYVNIVYTVKSSGGDVLGTYTISAGETDGVWSISEFALEGLKANTEFAVDCTVTPVSGPVLPASLTHSPVMVYVFKPQVVWQDSVIWLGETAHYDDNLVSVAWKNAIDGVPLPVSTAPVLQYQFAPAAGAFAQDTHVGVTVKIGGFNATSYTHFVHNDCGLPGCVFDPALGQFMVHVKSCSLTITKQGAANEADTFIFKVMGEGLTLYVSVKGNGSQMIVGLPVGSYTVTEEDAWSWRYTAQDMHVTLDASHASAAVTVSNTKTNEQWLGGDCHAVNTFSN